MAPDEWNDLQLKPGQAEDIPTLARIWHDGWHDGHAAIVAPELTASRTLDEFEDRTRAHLPGTLAAWHGDRIVGFCMIEGDELYQFYVAPSLRGSGLASVLMKRAEAAMGPGEKFLVCTVGNKRAARFYERVGWRRTATESYTVEAALGARVLDVWRYEKTLPGLGNG